ncbi:MAG: alkaline phosphatase family protein [Bryobacteraceae bacterium]
MTRRCFALLALWAALTGCGAPQPGRPKLVLAIVIDQFRYDYLTRFRADYAAGLDRLLRHGAVFTNARYEHFPTVTACGHAIFMTGAMPSLNGIVGNDWFDRDTGQEVTSVSDDSVRLLGAEGQGASPRRLLASTLGDEMKMAGRGKPRVIGISLKDRAAILPAGHMADGAYWFDPQSGSFVSSTFYFADLPQWVKEFNQARPADRYLGAEWKTSAPSPDYPAFAKTLAGPAGPKFYESLEASPFGNELVEAFAERAIERERLGQRGSTDLLTVSFSSNDYVGHDAGPDSPEVRDMALRADRLIGRLLDFVDAKVGEGNSLVALTADHGVAPLPEMLEQWKMPGGRLPSNAVLDAIEDALKKRFGGGRWVAGGSGAAPYFNRELIRARKLKEAEVQRVAAEAVAAVPHVFRVYTREQLLNGAALDDPITRRVVNGFVPSRSSDLVILEEAYWIPSARGSSHGSVFGYDAHVPVIFMGPNVRSGRYDRRILPNDIAPTLATMLEVETPSGAMGRVLTEMLERGAARSTGH